MKKRGVEIQREPLTARLLQDVLRVIYLAIFGVSIAAALIMPPRIEPAWLDSASRVMMALTVDLFLVAFLREILPSPPVGSVVIGEDRLYLMWLVSSAFAEITNHSVVRWPFSIVHFTRFLFLRAQGARVSYRASFPADLRVREPLLFTLERGAQIEPGVIIENAVHGTGRIRIDSVSIGMRCLVGAHVILMPGVSLAHDSRISPAAYIGTDATIGVGAIIGERAVLSAGVDVGTNVRIGAGAILGENAQIGDGARIQAGAVIPPNTRVREGEVWQGVPARPLYRDARGRPRMESTG